MRIRIQGFTKAPCQTSPNSHGTVESEISESNDQINNSVLCLRAGVLDIAGGRGELSFELQHVHQVKVTLVEPRAWAPWKLSKRQRGLLKASGVPWKQFCITQIQEFFTDELPFHLAQVRIRSI